MPSPYPWRIQYQWDIGTGWIDDSEAYATREEAEEVAQLWSDQCIAYCVVNVDEEQTDA